MQGSWRISSLTLAALVAASVRLLAQDSVGTRPAGICTALHDSVGNSAQKRGRDTPFMVDRVVAVVGSKPVLASQVDEVILGQQAEGAQLPREDDVAAIRALCTQTIQSIVDVELLVQQAQRDTTIKVTDEEISEGVTEQMRQVRRRFTSEADYRTDLRKSGFQTPDEYRRWLSDQQRRAAFQNRLIDELRRQGKLKPVAPTEQEIHAVFDEQKALLPKRPPTVSFRQIVITTKFSAEAKERARRLADSIATALRGGADFVVAARRFSADSVSAQQGGDLGWFRRGSMVTEFERVAFDPRMKPGTISPPVETPFGFHIIQVQRVQPAEVHARHILIVPDVDSIRIDSARALADSLYRLVAGGASFDSLQRMYHDRSAERAADNIPIDRLPAEYATAIGKADSGAVVPVFSLPGAGQRPQFIVCQVTQRRSEGETRYEDVKDQIVQRLSDQLAIRHYIDELKNATYVEVRF